MQAAAAWEAVHCHPSATADYVFLGQQSAAAQSAHFPSPFAFLHPCPHVQRHFLIALWHYSKGQATVIRQKQSAAARLSAPPQAQGRLGATSTTSCLPLHTGSLGVVDVIVGGVAWCVEMGEGKAASRVSARDSSAWPHEDSLAGELRARAAALPHRVQPLLSAIPNPGCQ